MAAQNSYGAFDWERRMGIHEAVHQNGVNRWIHWFCIPAQIFAVTGLLSLIPVYGPVDVALIVIAALAVVYMRTEMLLGAIMTAMILAMWGFVNRHLADVSFANIGGLALLLVAGFALQVLWGHGRFEEGRDDTAENFAEFGRTRNPIPLVLVFYYHLVEVAFHLGYRPALERRIAAIRDAEMARIGLNPRAIVN